MVDITGAIRLVAMARIRLISSGLSTGGSGAWRCHTAAASPGLSVTDARTALDQVKLKAAHLVGV
jgi:hypothetical protein